jgi:hypothetical protein
MFSVIVGSNNRGDHGCRHFFIVIVAMASSTPTTTTTIEAFPQGCAQNGALTDGMTTFAAV